MDNALTGLCVELGPEYVHGQPHVTLDLLQEAGIALEPVTISVGTGTDLFEEWFIQ